MKYKDIKEITTYGKYERLFKEGVVNQNGISSKAEENKAKIEKALDFAIKTRKFEISLYWKRAGYFWAFIVSIGTAYFFVQNIEVGEKMTEFRKHTLLLLLAGLGSFISLCWFLVNKASKYWQENWEKHIAMLQKDYMGPIYSTILTDDNCCKLHPFKYAAFSVSKINQFLSFTMLIAWVFLFISNIGFIKIVFTSGQSVLEMIIVIGFAFFAWLLVSQCHTSHAKKDKDFTMKQFEIEED